MGEEIKDVNLMSLIENEEEVVKQIIIKYGYLEYESDTDEGKGHYHRISTIAKELYYLLTHKDA